MLEVLEMNQQSVERLEENKNDIIFIADKIHPVRLIEGIEKFYPKKCFFKSKNGLKIEIYPHNKKEILICKELLTSQLEHECPHTICPAVLKILSACFETSFIIEKNEMAYVIEMSKIYPLLLVCLRQLLGETPLYFTMMLNKNVGTA